MVLSLIVQIGLCGFAENYRNNWYVLVDTSRYIFNYRHFSNVLGIYENLKKHGIKDDRIILLAPMTYACDPRNRLPGKIFYDPEKDINLYCNNPIVDIRGEDLSDINVINIIKGLYDENLPTSQKLMSDEDSDIMFYFTGHSGDEFFKIQDSQLLYSRDIGKALDIAYLKGKYRKILFISDTCEAFSWFSYVQAPNVMYEASSKLGESAISHGWDSRIENFLSDKYTFLLLKYFRDRYESLFKKTSLHTLFTSFDVKFLEAEPSYDHTLIDSNLQSEPLLDFFPAPFTTDSSSLFPDVQRYSIFERVKRYATKKDFEIAASFVNSL
ncbi:unnamed protein product [Moneuplotes crassus]|uniref:GPI-anchor transamidase n=1 Tax=Euplotes crassus TaxID=5936 RepID=A0AAD2D0N6_EUPCR|nr:unnamed protein product [Moneuplotes crassus]